MKLIDRSKKCLSLSTYNNFNSVVDLGKRFATPPRGTQSVLRMLIQDYKGELKLPRELDWLDGLVKCAVNHQESVLKVRHPFVYITVRSGPAKTFGDDSWHVDGFSTRYTHLPEQNYVWCGCFPTLYKLGAVKFHKDFDPLIHNINSYLERELKDGYTFAMKPSHLVCIDPYILHRRPHIPDNTNRTFVRISFTPIEIQDVNNTVNPLIPRTYSYDGVEEFRNNLKEFTLKAPH